MISLYKPEASHARIWQYSCSQPVYISTGSCHIMLSLIIQDGISPDIHAYLPSDMIAHRKSLLADHRILKTDVEEISYSDITLLEMSILYSMWISPNDRNHMNLYLGISVFKYLSDVRDCFEYAEELVASTVV